ncbi:MAG TPA: histidinol-phosphatase HisJ family protein [Candidatus Intestinimonas pullistercoris]|uniref:Histidinol-phosphatase n=2 Tax=Intestinimonas TaxID=1392389 RepID=A0A9D2NWF2_9FIRM|nr:histidinol-phosphatase HisJ family protein [Candidatus Intestinimonas pullistercoris]
MYLTDYHTHTRLSPDGEAPLTEMARAAVQAGLSELCVTDHYDLMQLDGTPFTEPYDWDPAVEQLREAQAAFQGRLTLRLGLELGSAPFFPDRAQAAVDRPEVDFVIGSLHNMTPEAGGGDFYYVDYKTPEICYACLDDYFGSMLRLAPMTCYDAMGHIIYPLRYMNLRSGQNVTLDRYQDQLREILRLVAQNGRSIEVNTYNGRTVADWKPVLELYREAGGELVTVGSDAHAPENVAKGVREAYALLADTGFRYVTVYEKRVPRPVRL